VVLNVHAPTEDKTDEVKDSFYEELERVFDKFPKYHMKILLENSNAKVGREDFLNRQLGIKVYTKLNLRVKSMMFPHRNIHKYTWTSPDGKTH
jgi:hydroxypyruvate isomerase